MGDLSIWMKLVVLMDVFLRGIWEDEKEEVMFFYFDLLAIVEMVSAIRRHYINILDILVYSCIYSHMHPLCYSNVHAHIYDLYMTKYNKFQAKLNENPPVQSEQFLGTVPVDLRSQ